MSKIKLCASLAFVLLLGLQPFSYAQSNAGQTMLSADPIVDVYGNLLIFQPQFSKTAGMQTEVTLVSPGATKTSEPYNGVLNLINRGEQAVYAIESVPPTVSTGSKGSNAAATLNLVALVTTPTGGLPTTLVQQSITGMVVLLKVAPGSSSDVIYLFVTAPTGPSVQVFTFSAGTFAEVGSVTP